MKQESASKHKLLETASKLIWENSYGAVSVDDICAHAGVKKGSFYYFFPSKADLTIAAMEDTWQTKRPIMDQIFSPQLSVPQRLDGLSKHIYESQKEKKEQFGKVCGCPYLTMGSELSTQDEKIRTKIEELCGRYLRYYESLVRDAVAEGLVPPTDIPRKALEMFSYVMGLVWQAKVRNDFAPLMLMNDGLLRLLGVRSALAA